MRLLVIDDEEDICDTIAEIASARGFDVATITDPAEVSDKLTHFTPDLIMLDLMMPAAAWSCCACWWMASRTAKVCLMSGSDQRVLNSARKLGSAHGLDVVAALEKPIDIAVLRATLDQMSGSGKSQPSTDLAHAIALGQLILTTSR